MDARQLEYFLAVVDHGGMSRAAAALYVAQPSLSQALRTLEKDLGQPLFHRIGRKLVLNDAGRALVEPARQVVRGLATARAGVESVSGLVVGRVEIAATPSQAVEPLPSLIGAFTAEHPGISVAVKAAFTASSVIDMVRAGTVEVGLLASTEEPTANGVHFTSLWRQRFVLVTPPDGPFAPGHVVQHKELAGRRLIVGQVGSGMRRLVDQIRDSGVDLAAVVDTEHREAILPLVLNGTGMAVLSDAWAGLATRSGARVHDLEPAAYLHISLATRPDSLSPAAAAFMASVS
ncbi:LysR family transcriptional regulator [Kutzneria chonburiensis]|uniref:LysR family transcriptional regulator n=1 Tax=Kutzneria chonburiensis TaxID=1483604 RepID=A0ABV6N7P2_9PSEU|nr:LysR family transcriptional regulator [Kutzneria chonburiensis]